MAKQIRERNIVRSPDIVVDPHFFVPDNIIGVRMADEDETLSNDPNDESLDTQVDDIYDENASGDSLDDGASYSDDVTDDPQALNTPTGLIIVSQTPRIGSDGRTVVDVVFDVSDVAGATDYEIRVTR